VLHNATIDPVDAVETVAVSCRFRNPCVACALYVATISAVASPSDARREKTCIARETFVQ